MGNSKFRAISWSTASREQPVSSPSPWWFLPRIRHCYIFYNIVKFLERSLFRTTTIMMIIIESWFFYYVFVIKISFNESLFVAGRKALLRDGWVRLLLIRFILKRKSLKIQPWNSPETTKFLQNFPNETRRNEFHPVVIIHRISPEDGSHGSRGCGQRRPRSFRYTFANNPRDRVHFYPLGAGRRGRGRTTYRHFNTFASKPADRINVSMRGRELWIR